MKKINQLSLLKKMGLGLGTVIILAAMYLGAVYYSHRQYFSGAVQTYINAQQIPTKNIISRKINYNWVNMGVWQETVMVKNYGKTLEFDYLMYCSDKQVSLEVYDGQNGLDNSSKLIQYKNLSYDNNN